MKLLRNEQKWRNCPVGSLDTVLFLFGNRSRTFLRFILSPLPLSKPLTLRPFTSMARVPSADYSPFSQCVAHFGHGRVAGTGKPA